MQFCNITIVKIFMWKLKLTLSTIKSIASAILLSTLSVVKFPISILFNTNEGKSQNRAEESLYSKIDVSVKVLQSIREATRGQLLVSSVNFWAINPPKKKNNILCSTLHYSFGSYIISYYKKIQVLVFKFPHDLTGLTTHVKPVRLVLG